MGRLILLATLLLAATPASAQECCSPFRADVPAPDGPRFGWGKPDVLIAEPVNHHTVVEAPVARMSPFGRTTPAQFVFTFENEVPAATPAIHAAAEIWSGHIVSPIPIKVHVRWVTLAPNVLGAAMPRLMANFSRALQPNVWFATALASALAGRDLNPDHPDMELQFNANFPNWYFGLDGNPPVNHWDFLTVVIHEIGHGLGFVGSMRIDAEGRGHWGFRPRDDDPRLFPVIYDVYAETDHREVGARLIDTAQFPNPSRELAAALQSEAVFFSSPTSVAANMESQIRQGLAVPAGGRPKLHAPPEWVPGSSYSHLTEIRVDGVQIYYPPGSLNSLMTPRLGATEAIRTPGAVTCGMFRDMGWPMGTDCQALLPEPPPLPEDPLLVVGPCPNPTDWGRTAVQVYVRELARVRGDLYDVVGRRVARLFDQVVHPAGPRLVNDRPVCMPGALGTIRLDLSPFASGIYLLRVYTPAAAQTVRIVHVR